MVVDSTPNSTSATPNEEVWASGPENLYNRGEISANEARQRSAIPVSEQRPNKHGVLPGHVHSVGSEVTARAAGLELVTEEHIPLDGARREAKLREPRPARTAKEKAARDMSEGLKHKTPPEWQPYVRVVSSGKDASPTIERE